MSCYKIGIKVLHMSVLQMWCYMTPSVIRPVILLPRRIQKIVKIPKPDPNLLPPDASSFW